MNNILSIRDERKKNAIGFISTYGAVFLLFALFLFFGIFTQRFLTWGNITSVLRTASIIGVISIGQTFVIFGRGIDLSVGSSVALIGMIIGVLLKTYSLPVFFVILIAIGLGALLGLINGIIITQLKVPDLISTIGTMEIYRGIAYVFWGGQVITGFSAGFLWFSRGTLFNIPIPIYILFIILFIGLFISRNTVLGKNILAIGGNREAAILSGISWSKYKILTYVISGITAGLGAVLLVSRLNAAQAVLARGYELETIAAVVLGGTSLFGGKGKVYTSLVGALVIAVMRNGMVLMGLQFELQMIFLGIVLILAVAAATFEEGFKSGI